MVRLSVIATRFRHLLLKHVPDPNILLNKDRMAERKALVRDKALAASVLMEVSRTYTDIAEEITGLKLPVCQNPREEIIEILDKQFGLIDRSQAPQGGSS